jgi:pheromone shutdown protein TraB
MQYVNEKTNNVLFIWWWSLPMSAILLAKKYNIQVDIVDCDIEAVESWIKLINKLWLSEKIQYFLWNANNFKTDKNYDSVFLAALVFQSNDINNILDNTQLLHFNSLFIRSAEGVRKLLYKPVDKKLINNYFSPIFEVHPKNELINSILIYKKK